MSICLVDTTVFCNIVPVPGRDQDRETVLAALEANITKGVVHLLPLAAIVETGNFVAQCASGDVRRQTAAKFAGLVRDAIEGRTPFTPTPPFEPQAVLDWLDGFPDHAMRGIGFADLSIVREFERQCSLHPTQHIFIWSLDRHLSGYERPAPLSR